VHVTVTQDNREARKLLEGVGRPLGAALSGGEVRVDSTEGPEEVDIPNN